MEARKESRAILQKYPLMYVYIYAAGYRTMQKSENFHLIVLLCPWNTNSLSLLWYVLTSHSDV